jgi:hypothetical protein
VRYQNHPSKREASVGEATGASVLERSRVPLKLIKESNDAALMRRIARGPILLELVMDLRHRMNGRNARHAETAEDGTNVHGGAHPTERAG